MKQILRASELSKKVEEDLHREKKERTFLFNSRAEAMSNGMDMRKSRL